MEKIAITKQQLLNARDYIPAAEKNAFIEQASEHCFEKLSITTGVESLPPMWMTDHDAKARFLMGALAGLYFGLDYARDETGAMSTEEYDRWAGSHVFGQLDRMKSDRELRDKVYDLLNDYFTLEKRLTGRLNGLLTVQNDAVVRQAMIQQAQIEKMRETERVNTAQLEELRKHVQELKRLRGDSDG